MIYNKLILPVFQIDEVSGGKLKSGEIIKEIVKGVLPGFELCESTKKQLAPEQTLVWLFNSAINWISFKTLRLLHIRDNIF